MNKAKQSNMYYVQLAYGTSVVPKIQTNKRSSLRGVCSRFVFIKTTDINTAKYMKQFYFSFSTHLRCQNLQLDYKSPVCS